MNRRVARAGIQVSTLVLLVATACDTQMRTPTKTVELYFQTIGRDPGRALSLLTDDFHATHGLDIASLEGWSWDVYENIEPIEKIDPDLAPVDAARGIDSAQTAWMLVQADPVFQETAADLEVGYGKERIDGLTAYVITSVQRKTRGLLWANRPFTQVFYLARADAGASWRISRIEQQQVIFEDQYTAFAASPSEASRRVVAKNTSPRRDRKAKGGLPPVPGHPEAR